MILEDTAYIRPASLHVAVQSSEPVLAAAAGANPSSFAGGGLSLLEQERSLVTQALERAAGNQSQAARG
jgi:hypothetical protein